MAVRSMPMGAPMGPPMGGPAGPPPAQAPLMPMGPQGAMMQGQQQPSSGPSTYGGSVEGRARFREGLRARKSAFMSGMQGGMPGGGQDQVNFAQMGGVPLGVPRMGGRGAPMPMAGPPLGRMVSGNASVGSAPLQIPNVPARMMGGGVVPLFRGLGRY